MAAGAIVLRRAGPRFEAVESWLRITMQRQEESEGFYTFHCGHVVSPEAPLTLVPLCARFVATCSKARTVAQC